jgi:hypothetical protein
MKVRDRESCRLKVFILEGRKEIGRTKDALVEGCLQREPAAPGAEVFLADL